MTESRTLMATCGSIDTWMRNAEGEDPCQIASRLLGKCTSNGVFYVPSILPGSSYPPPSSPEVNPCQCNTVAYSLMSACALCQNGSFQNFTTWVSNCPQTLVQYERYPNQTVVDVPSYAYLPLESGQFNLAGAKALDQAGEPVQRIVFVSLFTSALSISASSSLSSSPASMMTVLTSTAMAASTSPVTGSSTSKSSANLLIAITVGVSLTLLTALVGGLMFCRHRHRRFHPYRPFFSRRNRPISLSISSIDSDSVYEGKVTNLRPASAWDRVFSNFRLSHKTPSVSPYQRVKLSEPGLEITPPSKQLSHPQTQMSIKPSSETVPRGSNQRRTTWTIVLSKLGLLHNVTGVNVPYTQVELTDEVENVVVPNHNKSPSWRQLGPLDRQIPMLMNPSTTWSVPNGSNQSPSMGRSQPNGQHHSIRPKPTRIETLPVMQTISRTTRIRSSTIAEPSTTPRDGAIAVHRIPQQVENVSRPPGFTIEDTPTTTEGFPSWKRKGPLIRRDLFNPEMGGSMSSLGTFNSFSTQRIEGEDSDSVLLITRPSEIFSLTPKTSDTRSIRSFSATSVDDSSKSMAGSSRPPFSPAISSVVYRDTFRYGNPESREQLIPASVRAAGYKGVPLVNN